MPQAYVAKVAKETGRPLADVERDWEHAKAQVGKEYGGAEDDRFWSLVTAVFKRMAHGRHEDMTSGDTGGFVDAPCGPVTPTPLAPSSVSKSTMGAIVAAKAIGRRRKRRPGEDRKRAEGALVAGRVLAERHLRLPIGARRRWGETTFIKTAKGWLRDGPPKGDGADDLPEAPEAARRLASLVNKAEWDDADHRQYQLLRGYLESL